MRLSFVIAASVWLSVIVGAQERPSPQTAAFEAETLRHFQTLVRFDTSDPPGNEKPLADYLVTVLRDAGIDVQTYALESNRVNVVARLKGSGRKRPLLMMGHTDVVTVDPPKWTTHRPFSADLDGGFIYGRGTIDNKSSVVAGLMTLLELKRQNLALDRDVIFLAEGGEEGTTRIGIKFMVEQHFDAIDAEFCLAEGGNFTRENGVMRYAAVQTTEKLPRSLTLTSHGISGHASRPLESNAIAHLGTAVGKLADWQPPIRLGETTLRYFQQMAEISSAEQAQRLRDVFDPGKAPAAERWFRTHDPRLAAVMHPTFSPTMIEGGYRLNVIPSDAKATIDVRLLPDDNPDEILQAVKAVIADPAIDVAWAARDVRPGGSSSVRTEAYARIEALVRRHYNVPAIPQMGTGATDMAYLRATGMECYGIGPAIDSEDAPKGYGAHSDQERILESELQRFVRFHVDLVADLARATR